MNQTTFWIERPALMVEELPANRAETYGTSALADTELLALLLQGAGCNAEQALKTAREILQDCGSLAALPRFVSSGLGDRLPKLKATQLMAVVEIAKRLGTTNEERPLMNRAALTAQYMRPVTDSLDVEKFWCLCLDRKNRLLKRVEVTSGTATAALAHPREVFRVAIRENATAIVCVHNHPSGDPAPSAPDVQVTRQLREAAKAVDIELLDHVIIGRASLDPYGKGYFSFREAGMI